MHRSSVRGYVLAGGQSRRMGTDKALLFHRPGVTFAEHMAGLISLVTGEPAAILGPASRYSHLGLEVIGDVFPDAGPLAGIHAALSHAGAAERSLIVAVDLPNLTPDFLSQLISFSPDAKCVIAAGQPLCGVYRQDCLAAVEDALRQGRRKVTAFVRDELHAVEYPLPDPQLIANMNTLDDWQYHKRTP